MKLTSVRNALRYTRYFTTLRKRLHIYIRNQLHVSMWWMSASLTLASHDSSGSSKEHGSDSLGEYGCDSSGKRSSGASGMAYAGFSSVSLAALLLVPP